MWRIFKSFERDIPTSKTQATKRSPLRRRLALECLEPRAMAAGLPPTSGNALTAAGPGTTTLTPYGGSFRGGVYVAAGDITGDGIVDDRLQQNAMKSVQRTESVDKDEAIGIALAELEQENYQPSSPDGNTYYIGSANGGVWKTMNFDVAGGGPHVKVFRG